MKLEKSLGRRLFALAVFAMIAIVGCSTGSKDSTPGNNTSVPASSDPAVSVPSSSVPALTNMEKVEADLNAITFSSMSISANITLPETGSVYQSAFSWASSNASILSAAGVVNKPVSDTKVTLTVTGILSGATKQKAFEFNVLGMTANEKISAAKEALTFTSLEVDDNIVLPTTGMHETTIAWSSSNIAVITNTGEITRDIVNKNATLTATISLTGGTNQTKDFAFTVLARQMTDAEKVAADKAALTLPTETSANLTLPLVGDNGSAIAWDTSNGFAISKGGIISRTNVDVTAKLTAKFTLGDSEDTKDFDIKVLGHSTYETNEIWKATFDATTSSVNSGNTFGWMQDAGTIGINNTFVTDNGMLELNSGSIALFDTRKDWAKPTEAGVKVSLKAYITDATAEFNFELRNDSATKKSDAIARVACVAVGGTGEKLIKQCNSGGAMDSGYDTDLIDNTANLSGIWHDIEFYVKDGVYHALYGNENLSGKYFVTSTNGVSMGAADKFFNAFRIRPGSNTGNNAKAYVDNIIISSWDGVLPTTGLVDTAPYIRSISLTMSEAFGTFNLNISSNKTAGTIYYSIRPEAEALPAPATIADFEDAEYLNGMMAGNNLVESLTLTEAEFPKGNYVIYAMIDLNGTLVVDQKIVLISFDGVAISTAKEFLDAPAGQKYYLTNDIDFSAEENPRKHDWYGIIDGKGYTLKNLIYNYNRATSSQNQDSCLFSQASAKGKITLNNLIVKNVTVNVAASSAAEVSTGIIGALYSPADFNNVHVDGFTVNGQNNTAYAGVFVGRVRSVVTINIINSSAKNVNIVAGHSSGMVGGAYDVDGITVDMKNCAFYGNIEHRAATNNGGMAVGRSYNSSSTPNKAIVKMDKIVMGINFTNATTITSGSAGGNKNGSYFLGSVYSASSSIKNVVITGDMKTTTNATGDPVYDLTSAGIFACSVARNTDLSAIFSGIHVVGDRTGKYLLNATIATMGCSFTTAPDEAFYTGLGFDTTNLWDYDSMAATISLPLPIPASNED